VLTCMTPPPALFTLVCRNSSGRPIIFPNQFITTVSSSVQAGLDACKNTNKIFRLHFHSFSWNPLLLERINVSLFIASVHGNLRLIIPLPIQARSRLIPTA
jgi:hypothetical protein